MNNLQKLKQEMLDAVDSICESYKKELEAKEVVYEYPIYKVSRYSKQVVKFTELTRGITIVSGASSNSVGYKSSLFETHTDKDTWVDLPYDKDTRFYDMQIVACRDNKGWINEITDIYCKNMYKNYDIIEPVECPSKFMLEQQRLAIERFVDENM